ncbi:MAG: glycosyltransferase family 39 protein [bacterium]|nr:glycosyltransferase family 39 protein [bacterium]
MILALGVFFRFYLINQTPPGLYPDEATNGNNAVEALYNTDFSAKGGPVLGWKIFYPENNGREGLFINIQALSLWLLGQHAWTLRVVSALFGSLTIFGVYLLARELFRDKPRRATLVALFASFFLATSFWHINFSRIGFRAISVPFFSAFGIYFLLKGLRKSKISDLVFAGIFFGLGLHTYIAFRFMPFVVALPLAIYFWRWWRPNTVTVDTNGTAKKSCAPCAITLFIFVAFVVALPIGYYFLQNPQDFLGRSEQVSIFSAANPLFEFVKSNGLTTQMFFWRGDCNPRHNFACQPELFWPVAIFFAIGLVLAIKRAFFKNKQKENEDSDEKLAAWTILIWLFFMLLPATLTREGLPHALRSIGLIVPVFILAGWGAEYLWTSVRDYINRASENPKWEVYRRQLNRLKKEAALLLALLLLFIAFNAWQTYFLRFANNINTYYAFSTDLTHIGEYINGLPKETKKIIIVNLNGNLIRGLPAPAQTPMFISDTFSEEKRRAKNVKYLTTLDGLAIGQKEKTAILLLNSGDKTLIQEIKKRFPELKPSAPGDFISFESH